MIQISTKHRKVVVPYTSAVANLLPQARQVDWQGEPHLAIDHDENTTKLLRNFKYNIPAPILSQYNWPAADGKKPFDAQKHTAALLTVYGRAYVLNGMGTGKTKSTLWAFDWLRSQHRATRMLVVAPLSTLTTTWAREILATTPHLKWAVLHGSKEKRLKLLADPTVSVYIINHDGVPVILNDLKSRHDIDVVVLDELAVYRNGQAQRHKTMRILLENKVFVWGLTGAPTPTEPTDAWAQAKLVTPWNVPMRFTAFKESVMIKVSAFKWVAKPKANEDAMRIMQPAVRYTLDDIVELPETIFETIEVEQGKRQQEVYKSVKTHLHHLFTEGKMSVANSAVLTNKLLQISLGWVYTDHMGIVMLDNDRRMETLLDKVESTDRKVIVFAPYTHALAGTAAFLNKHGHPSVVVSGDVSKNERDAIFKQFQESASGPGVPRIIVAHPQCMAHGLTLTAADTIIWLGPFASLEIFDQANARITRIGQTHKQYIIMIAGTDVERRMYQRLQKRQQLQSLLLDMFREETAQRQAA